MLERQPGADAQGYSGLEDEVDNHWGSLVKAALLTTILGVGSDFGSNNNESDLIRALWRGAQDSMSQTGQQIVRRSLDIQPTLTIRRVFQSTSSSRAISLSRPTPDENMTRLKLGPIANDKPVKLSVELPASVHRDLIAYAEALARETLQPNVEPAKLVAPMLARFMATDRAFAKAQRGGEARPKASNVSPHPAREDLRERRAENFMRFPPASPQTDDN